MLQGGDSTHVVRAEFLRPALHFRAELFATADARDRSFELRESVHEESGQLWRGFRSNRAPELLRSPNEVHVERHCFTYPSAGLAGWKRTAAAEVPRPECQPTADGGQPFPAELAELAGLA